MLEYLFPTTTDPLLIRRRKFIDGLEFRAVAAITFLALLVGLDLWGRWASGDYRYTAALPYLGLEAIINAPYWFIGRRRAFPLRDFYIHWLVDLVMITAVLHQLGGVDLPYGFLAYLMIVVTSATFISKYASFTVAAGASICTCVLVGGEALGLLHHNEIWAHHLASDAQIAAVAFSITFYVIFAYLSGTLADQLKQANAEVDSARVRIEEHNRRLEEEVARRTEELRKRNNEIEEFVHIVTHDLKNVAVGAVETIRKLGEAEKGRLSDKGWRYAGHVQADMQRMNEMLQQLLGLFRVDLARARSVVDIRKLIDEILEAVRPRLEEKRVEVEIGSLPKVITDRSQLAHVLGNLVDNAVKYVGDKVRPKIAVSAVAQAEGWILTVADNGVGVPASQRSRIFNLYHRAPDQQVAGETQEGEGVGLAISKRIVERWGGRIWVEEQPEGGSRFSFVIPRSEDEGA